LFVDDISKEFCSPTRTGPGFTNNLLETIFILENMRKMTSSNRITRTGPERMQYIHQNDDMFHGSKKAYMWSGSEGMRLIKKYTNIEDRHGEVALLDFPSGYGRVLRFIWGTYRGIDITACDLNHEAVDFCEENFLVHPVYSRENLRELTIDRKFDIIWSGSLLTHLDRQRFVDTIDFYERHLSDNGIVITTTMGRCCAHELLHKKRNLGISDHAAIVRLVETFESDGFSYHPYDSAQDYGLTLVKPEITASIVYGFPRLRLVAIAEAEWVDFQDVVVLQKMPADTPWIS